MSIKGPRTARPRGGVDSLAFTELESSQSEDEFEDCQSTQEAWSYGHGSQMPRRTASVILRDGRRVRRSITMTSLNSTFRTRHNEEDDDVDVEVGASRDVPVPSSIVRYARFILSPVSFLWRAVSAPANRGLTKCVVAYFLASLVVFIPQISAFIGQGDGKHFVATCTVYFHPARSTGSIIQACIYAIIALAWAVLVSTCSMATAIGFNSIDQRAIGHAVVLIVWLCGGIGFIAYWKHRLGDPLVGVASSMASMVIFFNVTREGSLQLGHFNLTKLLQYFFIVLLGLVISVLVNCSLWPVSARDNLKRDMTQTTDQFSQLLSLTTRRFLQQGRSEELEQKFQSAFKGNLSKSASLQKNLKEARYEYLLVGYESEYKLLTKVVKCINNLAQHLNGLKSSCDVQLELMDETCAAESEQDLIHARNYSPSQDSDLEGPGSPGKEYRTEDFVRSFTYHLGPPMKSLAYTTKHVFADNPFHTNFKVKVNPQLFRNLDQALELYRDARESSLEEMYKHTTVKSVRGLGEMADREEIAASMDYFSYSLQEFAYATRDLMSSLEALEIHQRSHISRSWTFLHFWQGWKREVDTSVPHASRQAVTGDFSVLESIDRLMASMSHKIWSWSRNLKRTEMRFAIKIGIGASLFALPAMLDSTRPFFVEWRLEWGLLSFFIILNASVGGTYSAAFWRVLGSALGTGVAMLNWVLFPANPWALAPLGAAIAAPCMYMIVNPGKANAQFGRFILLSYNLTALYAYSISNGVIDDDDDEGGLRPIITLIALHRIVSVTAGCLWGALINTYIWPMKARVELRVGLSRLWLKLAWRLRQDPFVITAGGIYSKPSLKSAEFILDESLELQEFLGTLKSLLAQSPNEPRLRGRFPVEDYSRLIEYTQDILDSTYALNSALQKARTIDQQEMDLVSNTLQQRHELSDLIFLYLYLLASSMRLCLPLPHRFPRISNARDRLLAKISKVRNEHETDGPVEQAAYSSSLIYSLMAGQISKSLDGIADVVTSLFGEVDNFQGMDDI